MGTKIPYKPMVHIPRANYLGYLVKAEDAEGQFGPAWNMICRIEQEPYKGVEIAGWFPKEATIRNKTGKAIRAILGKGAIEREPDIEELFNKLCWLVIEDHHMKDEDITISKLMGVVAYVKPKPDSEPGQPGPAGAA